MVTDYLEGELSVAERSRFEAHMAWCDGCARYLAQMRLTIRATGALDGEAVPREAMGALLRAFRDWKRGG